MINKMKISVVVPAYNEEKFIARTLQSLKAQTYADFELIVVDNNSKDRTNEIACQFTDKVYVETQKGYMHAVTRGAAESNGELITFCDADTLYPATWLAEIAAQFQRHPAAVAVYGSCVTHDASPLMNQINGLFYTLFLWVSRWLGLDNTSGFNFVMKKSVFEKVGGYDPRFQKMSPDIELGKRLKAQGPIVYAPGIKVVASFRRYKDGGVLSTQWMFFKGWWAMLVGKAPSISYEEYNKEIR